MGSPFLWQWCCIEREGPQTHKNPQVAVSGPCEKTHNTQKMLKSITKNGILWQKGDNKGVFPVAFYFEMRWVKSIPLLCRWICDAWNAKIGFVPHSVFSSPCSSILLCMLCCTLAEYQPRFQKRIDISCGIYGIAYCYFLEKKKRLLSCWAVRATFTPLLAALDHGKMKKRKFL